MTNLTPAQERIIKIIQKTGNVGALVAQLSSEEKGTVHAPATEAMARKGLVKIVPRDSSRFAVLPGMSIDAPKAPAKQAAPKTPEPAPKAPEHKRFPPQASKAINRAVAKPAQSTPAKVVSKAKMDDDKPLVIIPERKASDLVALTGACYRAARAAGWPMERYDAILPQLDGNVDAEDNMLVLRMYFNITVVK